MKYKLTNELINTITPYINSEKIKVKTLKHGKRKQYKTDFVTIDSINSVSFEVFDEEIIVYYFDDHIHFEDYGTLEKGTDNYIKRAKEFLVKLFTLDIGEDRSYRKEKVVSIKYYFIYPNGKEEINSICYNGFFDTLIFSKNIISKTTIWKYDKNKGCFVSN